MRNSNNPRANSVPLAVVAAFFGKKTVGGGWINFVMFLENELRDQGPEQLLLFRASAGNRFNASTIIGIVVLLAT